MRFPNNINTETKYKYDALRIRALLRKYNKKNHYRIEFDANEVDYNALKLNIATQDSIRHLSNARRCILCGLITMNRVRTIADSRIA